MDFVKVENNTIVGIFCADRDLSAKDESYVSVKTNANMSIGADIRWFDKDGAKKPLQTLVDAGLYEVPEGAKIKDNQIVEMTDYDKYKARTLTLSEFQYADDETQTIKSATYQQLYDLKKITEEKYLEYLSADMRAKRDSLLYEVDRIASNNLWFASLTDAQKTELGTYRQSLLDVPQQNAFPTNIVWPAKPSFMGVE